MVRALHHFLRMAAERRCRTRSGNDVGLADFGVTSSTASHLAHYDMSRSLPDENIVAVAGNDGKEAHRAL